MPTIISRGEHIIILEEREGRDFFIGDPQAHVRAEPHAKKPGHRVRVLGGTFGKHIGDFDHGRQTPLGQGVIAEWVSKGDLQGLEDTEQ